MVSFSRYFTVCITYQPPLVLETAKDEKSLGEDNLNSQLHKHARESFHERVLLFFNTIYMMGKTPEEWKNSIVITVYMKGGKQRVENCSLMCYIKYSTVVNKN